MTGRSRQLVDALNTDLTQLVAEAKRKAPDVKLVGLRGGGVVSYSLYALLRLSSPLVP